jgi:hypothetical protein
VPVGTRDRRRVTTLSRKDLADCQVVLIAGARRRIDTVAPLTVSCCFACPQGCRRWAEIRCTVLTGKASARSAVVVVATRTQELFRVVVIVALCAVVALVDAIAPIAPDPFAPVVSTPAESDDCVSDDTPAARMSRLPRHWSALTARTRARSAKRLRPSRSNVPPAAR